MLFNLLTPLALVAVIGVKATPVFDFPDTIARADIPVGITVHEFDAAVAARGADEALELESRGLLVGRNDCKGSGVCGGVPAESCSLASKRYDSNSYYCGYTSRYSGHCSAIYRCDGAYDSCLSGGFLKQMFVNIYDVVGCGICGTYDIPNGAVNNCHATYNYCDRCSNQG